MEQKNIALIADWNQEGKGVARVDGKVVFIEGALPGEIVQWQPTRIKKSYAEGKIKHLLKPSTARVSPPCQYYAHCGGCSCQHIEFSTQVALKQRAWLNQMQRLGKVQPAELIAPIYGWPWHYRERVTLSVGYKHKQLQIGFRSRNSHEIVEISGCLILPNIVSNALPVIKAHLQRWPEGRLRSIAINQGNEVIALTLHTEHINSTMRQIANELIEQLQHQTKMPWQWWHGDGGQTHLQHDSKSTPTLSYTLPEYQIHISFTPSDFTQVNRTTNALMVHRAMQWLQPQRGESIIDWFCGLGNFSLPIARLGAKVTGVEGMALMCQRAQENAHANGLADYTKFYQADLFDISAKQIQQLGYAHKWLLDPPRAGAQQLISALAQLDIKQLPKRIVYISCDPATLARDVHLLVQRGYHYRAGGIMNLFAQTAHLESLAIFDWHDHK